MQMHNLEPTLIKIENFGGRELTIYFFAVSFVEPTQTQRQGADAGKDGD